MSYKPVNFSDFIWTEENSLSNKFCDSAIDKFENSSGLYDGVVGGGHRPDIKKTKDLHITAGSNYDLYLRDKANSGIEKYFNHCRSFHPICSLPAGQELLFDSYGFHEVWIMQKYKSDGYFKWHSDDNGIRVLSFIWYLNTLDDGHTEFIDGTKIKPEKNKLLIFPSNWNYIHCGNQPSSVKYIIVGWFQRVSEKINLEYKNVSTEGLSL